MKRVAIEFSSCEEVNNKMYKNYELLEPEAGIKPPGQMRSKTEKYCIDL